MLYFIFCTSQWGKGCGCQQGQVGRLGPPLTQRQRAFSGCQFYNYCIDFFPIILQSVKYNFYYRNWTQASLASCSHPPPPWAANTPYSRMDQLSLHTFHLMGKTSAEPVIRKYFEIWNKELILSAWVATSREHNGVSQPQASIWYCFFFLS